MKNVFFDTCVYHQPGIDLLLKVIPVDNILFASEMVGAVRGIDPETGTLRRHQALALALPEDTASAVYERNARRVYPRLDAQLAASGR
jgi:4-oxalmesaconate hydratase